MKKDDTTPKTFWNIWESDIIFFNLPKHFYRIFVLQFFQCQIDNANGVFEFQFANAEVRAKMRAAAERIAEMADGLWGRLCADSFCFLLVEDCVLTVFVFFNRFVRGEYFALYFVLRNHHSPAVLTGIHTGAEKLKLGPQELKLGVQETI